MTWRASAERWLTARWYGPGPVWMLLPLALVYALVLGVRWLLQRAGWQRPRSVGVPVIVVGNITVGGTGKTPFVAWLIGRLRAAGRHPGIVSRGHGRRTTDVRAVGPGATAVEVGDEALLHAALGVPVFVGRDRLAAARALCAAHPEVDVVLSDDGLGHRRLARALEVVMLDGERGLGNGWWLPAGPLRAPAARLGRADLVVATGRTSAVRVDAPVMHLDVAEAINLADGTRRPLAAFAGLDLVAVAGIGNPERFRASLRAAGLEARLVALPDHGSFRIADLGLAAGATALLTDKDAARLGPVSDARLWRVPVSARFLPHDEAQILDTVRRALATPGRA